MAMTEWQDVGMSGSEKEQLQAIYDAVTAGQVVFNMDALDTDLPIEKGTFATNASKIWTADKDYPYIVAILTATGTSEPNNITMTATLAESELSTFGFNNASSGAWCVVRIALVQNVKQGDTITFGSNAGNGCSYAILRNKTT